MSERDLSIDGGLVRQLAALLDETGLSKIEYAVGDRVGEGDVLLIIEAMKVMNEIRSPRAGRVAEILVEDGVPVEFGQVLLVVD